MDKEKIIGFPTKEYIKGKEYTGTGYAFKKGLITTTSYADNTNIWCKHIKYINGESLEIISDSDLVLLIARTKVEWVRSYLKDQLKIENRIEDIEYALKEGKHGYV